MLPVSMLLTFAGYGVGSYGWVLVKGYDISIRQWFSPLNPWTWPAPGHNTPRVPKGHIWPPGQAASSAQAA